MNCQQLYEKFPPCTVEKEAVLDLARQKVEGEKGRVVQTVPVKMYRQVLARIVIYEAPVLLGGRGVEGVHAGLGDHSLLHKSYEKKIYYSDHVCLVSQFIEELEKLLKKPKLIEDKYNKVQEKKM